jgi:hypothetical protein
MVVILPHHTGRPKGLLHDRKAVTKNALHPILLFAKQRRQLCNRAALIRVRIELTSHQLVHRA